MAALATVSDELTSKICHWETGKANVGEDPRARRPAVNIVTHPAGEATGGTDFSVCGGAGVCHAMESSDGKGKHPYL